MGAISVTVASELLVAKGYANLTGVSDVNASICYLPDPVCARLAMCLMDESWSYHHVESQAIITFCGKNKQWWAHQVARLYSSGVFQPEQGDLGEVMACLYI